MSTYDASTINIYKSPMNGDQVRFADGSLWTLKQQPQMKWGLYDNKNNVLHSAIGLHAGMLEFCAAINEQNEFLKYTLAANTAVHRGEHYI